MFQATSILINIIKSNFPFGDRGMIFKKIEWRILLRVLLLFATLSVASFLLVKGLFMYLVLVVPLVIYQLAEFYRFHYKAHKELDQFVESIHYRDFSRYFDVKHASADIQPLRKGFNEINTTFKVISKEKRNTIPVSSENTGTGGYGYLFL